MAPAPATSLPGSSNSTNGSGNGTSAVDIITYIGIPLAVLGVLPTMYTCLKSLATLRSVRKLLLQNNVGAITRSSLLSGIIEVEIPRKSLCPLDRADADYFRLGNGASSLKGGSWTQLNWRELSIGVKSYRLMYHDELCQPQAEVDLENLVAYLLDLGAVPDPQGWEDLRSSGLWTPAGTKLMRAPETGDAVLFVTTSEDSDGILSLGLFWRADWPMRRLEDLPPYWMRLSTPVDLDSLKTTVTSEEDHGEDGEKSQQMKAEVNRADTEDTLHDNGAADHDSNHLSPKSAQRMSLPVPSSSQGHKRSFSKTSIRSSLSMISFQPSLSNSIRIRLGRQGLVEASYENLPTKKIKLPHLTQAHHGPASSLATWFASAATALGADQGSLWAYTIPPAILSLAQRETVPGAALVLLDLLEESAVPAFRTPFDDKMAEHEAWAAQQRRIQRQMERIHMTPEERSKAFHRDFVKERAAEIENNRRKELEAERRKEDDLREALASQRVNVGMVAEACRKWLVKEEKVREGVEVVDVVEFVLWEMVRDAQFGSEVARMLDMWKEWSEGGGMTKTHFETIKKDKLHFAYAACVLSLIKNTADSAAGSVVSDLQDCLRMWRKVRLG